MKPNQIPRIIIDFGESPQGQIFPSGQCDCDCDCACANILPTPTLLPYSDFDILSHRPGVVCLDVNDDFYLLVNPRVSRPALYNAEARKVLDLFDGFRTIEEITANVPGVTRDVVESIAKQSFALGILGSASDPDWEKVDFGQPKALTAWLHVTNDCNLACEYCYVHKTGLRMTEAIGIQSLEKIFSASRQYGYEKVKLKYAGGEPTLNFTLIEKLSKRARQLAVAHKVLLEEVMLTNGVALSPKMLNFIAANKFRLMISLDELEKDEIGQRPARSGANTSAKAKQSIERCLEYGIKPEISVTIARQSSASLSQVVTWLLARKLPFSLNFFRPSNKTDLAAAWLTDPTELVGALHTVYTLIAQDIPHYELLTALLDRVNLVSPHTTPCQVGRDYLVIDPLGNIAKCQMDMEHPIGNILTDNDPLALVRESLLGVANISVEEKPGCSGCTWKFWCAGGCPLEAGVNNTRSMFGTTKCKIYHALIPEVLRLEGLRLLSFGTDVLH